MFESVFAVWKRLAESLNQQLRPIVHAEVDINAPDWQERLATDPHPADACGRRREITALFNEIVNDFESFNAEQRQQVVDLMDQNDSLMYSAVIDADINTPEGFRKHMILEVLRDQGKDPRDAIVALTDYRKQAERRGIDVDSIFEEMARIASTRDKYGWGTTRDLFMNG